MTDINAKIRDKFTHSHSPKAEIAVEIGANVAGENGL